MSPATAIRGALACMLRKSASIRKMRVGILVISQFTHILSVIASRNSYRLLRFNHNARISAMYTGIFNIRNAGFLHDERNKRK